ncbi:thioesterase family protein [Stappia sp. TSB10GB4]|uniref:acyl-CoA thioesterase n=1 Tax=Stappia sp. TSB10GB4 TaxID=2003584 RepID=UPI0016464C3A|nr:thioesterase family protein [Stappia sp. TSB10GB4]
MPAFETLFSFVNCWECDENDHLNVQFYLARFDEADRQFRLLTGLSDALAGVRRARHVRYHAELYSGDTLVMTSHIAFDGPYMLTVVHELRRTIDGALAATAVDGYAPSDQMARELRKRFDDAAAPMPDAALPRGLATTPEATSLTARQVEATGGALTHRATVLPRHIGPDGRAEDAFALACFSEAAPHLWNRTPMTEAWLEARDLGRVAVEMKLVWTSPLKLGDTVMTLSGVTGAAASTFSFRHYLFEARANRLALICDVVALTMSLKTRRAVRLEDQVRGAIVKDAMKR